MTERLLATRLQIVSLANNLIFFRVLWERWNLVYPEPCCVRGHSFGVWGGEKWDRDPCITVNMITVCGPGTSSLLPLPDEIRAWLAHGPNISKVRVESLAHGDKNTSAHNVIWSTLRGLLGGDRLHSGGFGFLFISENPQRRYEGSGKLPQITYSTLCGVIVSTYKCGTIKSNNEFLLGRFSSKIQA